MTSIHPFGSLLLKARNQDLTMFNPPEVRKVKRILFGPVDHQATQRFIEDEMKKIIVNKSEKWNFDFKKESTLSPDGIFEWNPVSPKKQVRPAKRRADDFDNSEQYYQFSEADIVRPRPVKSCKIQQQSRITDFMKFTKRPSSEISISKKQPSSDWNSEIPSKIAKIVS